MQTNQRDEKIDHPKRIRNRTAFERREEEFPLYCDVCQRPITKRDYKRGQGLCVSCIETIWNQ